MLEDTYKSWSVPVDDPRHTEVLGNHCTTKHGKRDWESLDWSEWRLDHATEPHMFSHGNCSYFHVKVRDEVDKGCVYRVRCWYAGGQYRGWPVVSVGIEFKNGRLFWVIGCKRESE